MIHSHRITLHVKIESCGPHGYTGSVVEIPGLVEQEQTMEDLMKEILLSVNAKFAYDNNLSIERRSADEQAPCDYVPQFIPHDEMDGSYLLPLS